jgi:hypothetical protein
MPRFTSTLTALLAACAVSILFEGSAAATPDFPAVVQDTWKVKLPGKGCKLCHTDEVDSAPKTVGTLVGYWFYNQGLRADKTNMLKTLLAQSKDDEQDSDGDGVSDYQELADGKDPNVANVVAPPAMTDGGVIIDAGPPVVVPTPQKLPPLLQTGCSVTIAARSPHPHWLLAALLAAASFLPPARARARARSERK